MTLLHKMLEQEWEDRAKAFGFKSGAEYDRYLIEILGKAWKEPKNEPCVEHEHYGA